MTLIALATFLFALLFAVTRRKTLWLAMSISLVSLLGLYMLSEPLGIKSFERLLGVPYGLGGLTATMLLLALLVIVDLYLHLRAQAETITRLARKITLLEAARSEDKKP